ncbi:hydrolase 2, exosortase A system-associated [Undibacterium sp. SXout20W]|uniref:hydrolase 2, exosortase A system-associated n=1 Tax=Undibacterium sp. SXout20W TaxID=3413051 RepID=UPI003BEF8136
MSLTHHGIMEVNPPPQAFFLPAAPGQRFCMYHPTALKRVGSDCILHIHAFAEEMNKGRCSAGLLARRFAENGLNVLQIDLLGCGDSSGDFAEADWNIWKADLIAAVTFLKEKHNGKLHLWADRLGSLLAAELIAVEKIGFDQVLLCQPVFDGNQFVHQFKRSLLARAILNKESNSPTLPTEAHLTEQKSIEIAGYDISHALLNAISEINISDWNLPATQIQWIEMMAQSGQVLSPSRQRIFNHWQQQGNQVRLHIVNGSPCWQSPEGTVDMNWIERCASALKGTA